MPDVKKVGKYTIVYEYKGEFRCMYYCGIIVHRKSGKTAEEALSKMKRFLGDCPL